MTITVKRAYDDASPDDGVRVLVDRLWPRGVAKADAHIDVWLKNIAPSNDLRSSWHSTEGWHEGAGFDDFRSSYRDELKGKKAIADTREALDELKDLTTTESAVTLVTASKDPEISHVAVILEVLGHGKR